MKDQKVLVEYQIPLPGGYYRIGMKTGWSTFVPGQFGMLEVPRQDGVLLRRPFSFARQLGAVTEILYKAVGRGTEALSRVSPGQNLRLLGPLGHGFSEPQGEGEWVGVAGGYGIAPFLEMAAQMQKKGRELRLFYGARSEKDLIYIQELKELKVKLYLSTQDGSAGARGLVTEALQKSYAEKGPALIWACGPTALLAAVQAWAQAREVACELSVEETMGCGTGVCLGCVVRDRSGHYRRACIEGPVFSGDQILMQAGI
ncbi:MAG TPA: dihydroorotate dehydrogenase electron transfer subunit [Deltaproteobacteria bacterium]|nr:dihydroorotate dehydrogenase electron transfer subunit [Deltaproteobacteria bacterium]